MIVGLPDRGTQRIQWQRGEPTFHKTVTSCQLPHLSLEERSKNLAANEKYITNYFKVVGLINI